jgi:hypothetical protein
MAGGDRRRKGRMSEHSLVKQPEVGMLAPYERDRHPMRPLPELRHTGYG